MLASQSMIRGSIIKSWNELMGNQDRQNHKHFFGELLKSSDLYWTVHHCDS